MTFVFFLTAKLGIFYFFFYIGLAGFFCAMLAVFMAISPRDRPRYYLEESRMRTRSNPLSPGKDFGGRGSGTTLFFSSGLGFRPQPDVEKNIIMIDRNAERDEVNQYARSLDHYLHVCKFERFLSLSCSSSTCSDYSNGTRAPTKKTDDDNGDDNNRDDDDDDRRPEVKPFTLRNAGECNSANQYGYPTGRPCVLVKMNKVRLHHKEIKQDRKQLVVFPIRLLASNLDQVRPRQRKPSIKQLDAVIFLTPLPLIVTER